MAKTIVGMFHSRIEAERVARDIEQLVPDPREIQVLDARDVKELSGRQESHENGGFWSWLFGDVNEAAEDRDYDERLGRGEGLVMVTTDDERADLVQHLMEESGLADDVEQREAGEGGEIGPETSRPTRPEPGPTVVEERIEIGPRGMRRVVRVYTHITERPVEEQIRLRDERMRRGAA